jgi:toxin ParE1/3/4
VGRRVILAPEAQADLIQIYNYIEEQSGQPTAHNYVQRVTDYCEGLADFPERGTLRDELFPGLRVIGFERRVTIAFHVFADEVRIDRILYGGRDLESIFSQP